MIYYNKYSDTKFKNNFRADNLFFKKTDQL